MAKFNEWSGRPYVDWCAEDPDDERKIYYTVNIHTWSGGWRKERYTSDDKVNFFTLQAIRMSTIRSIELRDNEWHVELEYYAIA